MNLIVVPIDSAVSIADADIESEKIKLIDNEKYKYLSAFPTGVKENGKETWIPMCSDNMKKWVICVGATVKGEKLDVREIAKAIREKSEGSE